MRRIGLALVDEHDEYQELLAREAAAAATRGGFALDVRASGRAGYALGAQLKLIDAWLREDAPPEALLVLPAGDRGLAWAARRTAQQGIHWISLVHTDDDLDAVRDEFPGVAVATVCPDERACGYIQARLVSQLVAGEGRILYLGGDPARLVTQDRAAGFAAGTAATAHEVVSVTVDGTASGARSAVQSSLRIAAHAQLPLHAVVCQTDVLADGALEALRAGSRGWAEPGQPWPRHGRLPVVGCGGLPTHGQALVASGRLAATIVLPRSAATAIGLLSSAFLRGTPVPAFTPLAGQPWPESPLSLRPPA